MARDTEIDAVVAIIPDDATLARDYALKTEQPNDAGQAAFIAGFKARMEPLLEYYRSKLVIAKLINEELVLNYRLEAGLAQTAVKEVDETVVGTSPNPDPHLKPNWRWVSWWSEEELKFNSRRQPFGTCLTL